MLCARAGEMRGFEKQQHTHSVDCAEGGESNGRSAWGKGTLWSVVDQLPLRALPRGRQPQKRPIDQNQLKMRTIIFDVNP